MKANSRTARRQQGFTVTQMVVTLGIIAVVSTFGVLGIRTARAEFRLQNSARLFATYIEKARADAIRRHVATGAETIVETFEPGTSKYEITMDFGNGTVETRKFTLESGLSFDTAPKKVKFDWRGRIAEAWVFQIFSSELERSLPVDVSGSGDITVGEQHFPDQLIPEFPMSEVADDVDTSVGDPSPSPTVASTPNIEASPSPEPDATASPSPSESATPTPSPSPSPSPGNNGNGNGNDGNNGNDPHASPTPTPSPSPSPIVQCSATISPSRIELSQSIETKQTGTATFTMTNASGVRIITPSQAGNGSSLVMKMSQSRIDGNGSSVITVTAKQGAGNRGTFMVNILTDPACGTTQQLEVFVSN